MDASPKDRRLTERGRKKGGVVGGGKRVDMERGRREPPERSGDRRRTEARVSGERERSSDDSCHGFWVRERRPEERRMELKALHLRQDRNLWFLILINN